MEKNLKLLDDIFIMSLNNFFLIQLIYNCEKILKNISDQYSIDYTLLEERYLPKNLEKRLKKIIEDRDLVLLEPILYKDIENNNYIVINDPRSNFNAILID